MDAIRAASSVMVGATNPVISVNGNVVALAAREIVHLSEVNGAKVEINLFHRTPERVAASTRMMGDAGVKALGENADANIPRLTSERAKWCSRRDLNPGVRLERPR